MSYTKEQDIRQRMLSEMTESEGAEQRFGWAVEDAMSLMMEDNRRPTEDRNAKVEKFLARLQTVTSLDELSSSLCDNSGLLSNFMIPVQLRDPELFVEEAYVRAIKNSDEGVRESDYYRIEYCSEENRLKFSFKEVDFFGDPNNYDTNDYFEKRLFSTISRFDHLKPPALPGYRYYNYRDSEEFRDSVLTVDNVNEILEKLTDGTIKYDDLIIWIPSPAANHAFYPEWLVREKVIDDEGKEKYLDWEIHYFEESREYEKFPAYLPIPGPGLDESEFSYEYYTYYPVETKERDKSEQPRAFITGVAGQDGSYLAEFLLSLGYEVYGCDLKGPDSENLAEIKDKLNWVDVNLSDQYAIRRALRKILPDEIYHLAGHTHVGESFDQEKVYQVWHDIVWTNKMMLRAAQKTAQETGQRLAYFFAGTSELFGNQPAPQNELTQFAPVSPYAISKREAVDEVRRYRQWYGKPASVGLMFNHGSIRRPDKFVERKISMAVALIQQGLKEKEKFGNIKSVRDFGSASEYVQAMHKILQQEHPNDYVIGTGVGISIENLLSYAFSLVGKDWRDHVEIDESLLRPIEVNALIADASKARRELGWAPTITAKELIGELVEHDLQMLRESSS